MKAENMPVYGDVEHAQACRELLDWQNRDHTRREFKIEFGQIREEDGRVNWCVVLRSDRKKRPGHHWDPSLLAAVRGAIKHYESGVKKR